MNGRKKLEILKKLETGEYVLVVRGEDSDYTVVYYFDHSFLFITIRKSCKLVRLTWRKILSREVYHRTDTIGHFLNFDYTFFRVIRVGGYIQKTWIRKT